MFKVIVDRPRRRAGCKRKGRSRPLDQLPKREGMSRGRGSKRLNENLAPLKRYLNKQVGRPWDKVYSDVRQALSPRNQVHMHVIQHLWDYVERRPRFVDGVPVHTKNRWRGSLREGELFVCPKTGLLRRWSKRR